MEIQIIPTADGFAAEHNGYRVGYAWFTIEDRRMRLEDIRVEESVRVMRRPFWLLNPLGYGFAKIHPRGQRAGSRLLDLVIRTARNRRVTEIYGSVTPAVLKESPFVLQWYERQGFAMLAPDSECIPGSLHKISMSL